MELYSENKLWAGGEQEGEKVAESVKRPGSRARMSVTRKFRITVRLEATCLLPGRILAFTQVPFFRVGAGR